ncbi:MAG TPA: diadenylate cyclase [Desulfobacteraceae bacterium]|nr:diadenylate cyclase [Desulfobacteraceae bacterium]
MGEMIPTDYEHIPSDEEAIKERLADLKCQVLDLHGELSCLKQCSYLGSFLQEIYEIREGLGQLEKGLLQQHLKCCISPSIKVPGEVVLVISKLSSKRHGAIIVIEQENNLEQYLRQGVTIEAEVSGAILESIFYPGNPLHDGATLIRNGRIQKARCLLPLAPHALELERLGLGTRHRAALGLSQVSDALVIVVSEEKGWISMALGGRLYPNLGTFALLKKLENEVDPDRV